MALLAHIRAIHSETRGAYGWPRMWRELRGRGVRVGKVRVRKMMKDNAIRARAKRKFKAAINSNHKLPVCENILNRNSKPSLPDTVWTGGVTCIPTNKGWLYLSVVIDALTMARFRRRPAKGLIFHSDRGSQYAGVDFQNLLKRYGVHGSINRKGDYWDNAVTETLFGSLKAERLHGMTLKPGACQR